MFALISLLSTALAAPRDYGTLGGTLYVQVYKDPTTVAAALSHDHVIRSLGWSGKATWDASDPSACAMDIRVPVKTLDVDDPALRELLGYDTFPDADTRADVAKTMLGSSQLDAAKFPFITFEATSCSDDGDLVRVEGDLTIKGTTRRVSVPMAVKADDVNFSAKGSLKIKGSDYGIEPYSAGLGALRNQDTMILVVALHGKP